MDLHANQLNGGLQPSWGSAADMLHNLQVLDLSSNTLSGMLPYLPPTF